MKHDWPMMKVAFAAMGDAGLEEFHEVLVDVLGDDAPSEASCRRHSASDDWAAARADFARHRAEAAVESTLATVVARDREHAALARAMREVALLALGRLAERGGRGVDAAAAARLAAESFRIERVIAGEATDVQRVILDFHNVVVSEYGRLFKEAMHTVLDAAAAKYGRDEAWERRTYQAAAGVFGPGADKATEQYLRSAGLLAAASE